jgi:predicted RNA-binding Zn-ribbon protein involved in translation (DUF1610 family)
VVWVNCVHCGTDAGDPDVDLGSPLGIELGLNDDDVAEHGCEDSGLFGRAQVAVCDDCAAYVERALQHQHGRIGRAHPEELTRRCRRCGASVRRHDDIIPWECPNCGLLERDSETYRGTQAGVEGW